jgi:hypothetical protein
MGLVGHFASLTDAKIVAADYGEATELRNAVLFDEFDAGGFQHDEPSDQL